MQELRKFDPSQYLIRVKGADYLEVKWRIAWLRAEHPDAKVETELVQVSPERAVFRAQVSIPDRGSATGWGTETPEDFGDYIEKAETKALGRALAALGFGTQFCFDFDGDGDGMDRVVDAPVRLPSFNRPRPRREEPDQLAVAAINQTITPRQRNFLSAIAREKGMSEEDVEAEVQRRFDIRSIDDLDRRQASALIEALRQQENMPLAS